MRQIKPFIGRKFGQLTVLREVTPPGMFLCQCSCGNEVELFRRQLTANVARHCGCLLPNAIAARDRGIPRKYFHQRVIKGGRKHKTTGEFISYRAMLRRCLNPADMNYADYGGRGIQICARWREPRGAGFRNFLDDLGPRPLGMTLDRKDVQGHYEPGNCRWLWDDDQKRNRRNVLFAEGDLRPVEPLAEPDFSYP